jgi:hypothetical protein
MPRTEVSILGSGLISVFAAAWKTCITTKRQRALTLTPLQADLPITGQDQPFTIELLFNAEGVPLEQIPKATKLVVR